MAVVGPPCKGYATFDEALADSSVCAVFLFGSLIR